ncbi:MAG: deoxyguanosinetriphosphate triphosphohydrolase, partial [Clostridia bacterium]|nr:deoxyguanosinetriphosphate triphosphohydrolase [Clostridia bacterium]
YNRMSEECGKDRSVCDYLASMTDRYAVSTYENLFIPNDWR